MSFTVAELATRIGETIQLDKAAGWDPVGLQLGDPEAAVGTVAVCHEVTPEVLRRLIELNVDMAISYHPLLFRPVTRLVKGSGPPGRAFALIANRIALSIVHTAFDAMAGGTADALAQSLGLEDVSGFGPVWGKDTVKIVTFAPSETADAISDAMAAAGAGRIGDYSNCSFRAVGTGVFLPGPDATPHVGKAGELSREGETRIEMIAPATRVDAVVAALVRAHPYEEPVYDVVNTRSNAGFVGRRGRLPSPISVAEMAERVSRQLGGVVRVSGTGPVSTIAVVPGSGGSLLLESESDLVVTGDVSHHRARAAADQGIAVIDPGHAATERPGVQALYAAVAKTVETIEVVDLTDVDHDPWKER